MAYIQKNNPFKKVTDPTDEINTRVVSNPEDLELAKRLNKLRFNMGHIFPITSEEEIREKRQKQFEGPGKQWWIDNPEAKERAVQRDLLKTAQTEKERKELYAKDPSGRGSYGKTGKWAKDLNFIKTAREAGGKVFNKVMSMPEKDIVNLERDVVEIAQPFRGKNLGKDPVATLKELRNLDLTRFKPYLQKSGLEVSDISNVIASQLNNLPDLNKDGTPDAFEGIKGKILRKGIDYLISNKLEGLK